MSETAAHLAGELSIWPSKRRLVAILRDAGLRVVVGSYSIRVKDCSHFDFQEYGGGLGDPVIDAAAESAGEMLREGKLVSDALARAGIKHRFEISDDGPDMVGYLHHNWPHP